MNYKEYIREVPNFPKEGILYYDITTLLSNEKVFKNLINEMTEYASSLGATKVAGIESRGFIFGTPIALNLNLPFIPIRKPGKLPYKVKSMEYYLEYGKDSVEIHEDAVNKNDKIILIDDLLATGGTIEASAKLVESLGAKVASMIFAIELKFLNAKNRLNNYDIKTFLTY